MGTKTIGRNAPCPCGSGKQYKQCCREKDRAAQSEADRARVFGERQVMFTALQESQELDEASNAVVRLVRAGELDRAEHAARVLLERYPEVTDGYERLGMVYEARGDLQQAGDCYRKAIEMVRADAGSFSPQYEQDLVARLRGTEKRS